MVIINDRVSVGLVRRLLKAGIDVDTGFMVLRAKDYKEYMMNKDITSPVPVHDSATPGVPDNAPGKNTWRDQGQTNPNQALKDSPTKNPVNPSR